MYSGLCHSLRSCACVASRPYTRTRFLCTSPIILTGIQSIAKNHARSESKSCSKRSPNTSPYSTFNRKVKGIQIDRALDRRRPKDNQDDEQNEVSYVHDFISESIVDRLLDIKRPVTFPKLLLIGSGSNNLYRHLCRAEMVAGSSDVVEQGRKDDSAMSYEEDDSPRFADVTIMQSPRTGLDHESQSFEKGPNVKYIYHDEEELSDFVKCQSEIGSDKFDAVIVTGTMHWLNDPAKFLNTINSDILKPDGLFLGAMPGNPTATLHQLRSSLHLANLERTDRIMQHVSPMADPSDISSLMKRAGLTLLTVDTDELDVAYPSIFELMTDLQAMGESSAPSVGPAPLNRDALLAASSIYQEMHGLEDGSVPATFLTIFMIGWKPAPNQQQPSARGSGTSSLKELLEKDR